MDAPRILLASTSPYRAELLKRLGLTFEQRAPGVDEAPLEDEAPSARALRLAAAKARAVAAEFPQSLVIGSDQVAELDGEVLDKPGSAAVARAQLRACSGASVRFHTAVCVVDTRTMEAPASTASDVTVVHFRPLDADTIARYVEREQPLDCAGSFKCEGLGIALFERIECRDPTALIGLPLIALSRLLREHGLAVP
jgi:septum formation protein